MKRLSIAKTALVVMGLMTMVSCRKPNVNNVVPGAARTVTFNATTESGNGSKTYLDGSYVKWSANDVIYVNGTETGNQLTLASEPGSTFGSFSSQNFTATMPYMVGYPQPTAISKSQITFTIPAEQNIYNNGSDYDLTGVVPMAAYTANENGDLAFKNMVNVLKLDLTGTQTINTIEVESAAENLSGNFTVNSSIVPTAINAGTITKKITITKNMTLTDTPQTVYVVLPVFGNAESTITVKFTGDDGVMTVGPKALTVSTTPNHRYSAGLSVLLETPWDAYVVTIPVCAIHSTCASSGGVVTGTCVEEQGICWSTSENPTVDGSHYVHQYEYATGSLTPKNTTSNNTFTGFIGGSPDSENRLTPGTTYHVRAYIRNGSQVKYGDDVEFKTLTDAEESAVTGVNLGLPSGRIWATCNLGAANEYDYGDYYMWGDNAACTGTTSGKAVDCYLQSYRFEANSSEQFTKYCPTGSTSYWYSGAGSPDNNLNFADCTYADDCVRRTLGGDWRMPTTAEWKELYDNTTRTWTTSGGVNGWRFTGKGDYSGYSIFLPAAGARDGASLDSAGSGGGYWSSSLDSSNPSGAYGLFFNSGDVGPQRIDNRYYGYSVRPVR